MRIMREINALKTILLSAILFLLVLVLTWLITRQQYHAYMVEANNMINTLVYEIKSVYPAISEETIIHVLNSPNTTNQMAQYGIDLNKDSIILTFEAIKYKSYCIYIFLFVIYSIILFMIYWHYHKKSRNKVDEITGYIKEINQKNYYLDIMDNSEDELSILKNEIYKTTVMLKEQAENLKKNHSILKESLSNISHQLKTPLTSISLMLDNILENPTMEESIRNDFICDIKREINHMEFFIQNLLKLSKFEADAVTMKCEKIEVEKLLQTVLKNLEIMMELKNIAVVIYNEKKAIFNGDFRWEVEAIMNILKNCMEHSLPSSKIEILVFENSLYTEIKIQDYGTGIAKKDLQQIFKRFHTSSNALMDSIGIGLSLSKNIIEKDNGIIIVQSEENKGTQFTIQYHKK